MDMAYVIRDWILETYPEHIVSDYSGWIYIKIKVGVNIVAYIYLYEDDTSVGFSSNENKDSRKGFFISYSDPDLFSKLRTSIDEQVARLKNSKSYAHKQRVNNPVV